MWLAASIAAEIHLAHLSARRTHPPAYGAKYTTQLRLVASRTTFLATEAGALGFLHHGARARRYSWRGRGPGNGGEQTHTGERNSMGSASFFAG
jgi:hypothetical protein